MEKPEMTKYIIRVYALIINKKGQILLSDEFVYGQNTTKFPGGGMEYGEGPLECIQREAMEEFGQEIEISSHFYTTHFYQRAFFFEDHQLISIYYRAHFKEPPRFRISVRPFDFPPGLSGGQSFRWVKISSLTEDRLTFPVDRYVLKLLKAAGGVII